MMRVRIISWTHNPERVVAASAKLCYSKASIEEISEGLDEKRIANFIKKLFEMGHLSPFEHVSFTFGVEGISRACSHQLVRHRIASYSQQSQRYVRFDEFPCVVPESIQAQEELLKDFKETEANLKKTYRKFLKKGIPPEDARYILPNAFTTKIVVTMNARELFHFFKLRTCNRAQWEIRNMADEMLKEAKRTAPLLFKKAGPGCLFEKCEEGKLSCGKPRKEILGW